MNKRNRKVRKTNRVLKSGASAARRKQSGSTTYILEHGTARQLRSAKSKTMLFLKYKWDYYAELAYQRSRIEDSLTQALNESCRQQYEFQKWQRAVKYKYSLHPLSTVGSVRDIGGRFNIGDINPSIPTFPALYLASDKDTALQETLGQIEPCGSSLSAHELALTNPDSETIVSASGQLDRVFDLRSPNNLRSFTALIRNFSFSPHIYKQARALGIDPPTIIETPSALKKSLLDDNWRIQPRQFDVPSNSQIFGHLVYSARIEGIIYPSKLTGKDCLAIFPANLENTSSFIDLDDPPPHDKVPTRIDGDNWRICDLGFEDLPD